MKRNNDFLLIFLASLIFVTGAFAADKPQPAAVKTVSTVYPNLTSGALSYAKLKELPSNVIVRAGNVKIFVDDIEKQIAQVPGKLQEKMRNHAFFLLEDIATSKLLIQIASNGSADPNSSLTSKDHQRIVQGYLKKIADEVKISDAEAKKFFDDNPQLVGGYKFEAIKNDIKQYLLGQKQTAAITEHIRTLGQRVPIEISSSWVEQKAIAATNNPVDKARNSGLPTLVDFGSDGCRPCEMMAPILDKLKNKYAGKMNVVFVHTREHPFLASRFDITAIPVQVLYDKNGKQIFRHTGYFSEDQLEAKIAELGVK